MSECSCCKEQWDSLFLKHFSRSHLSKSSQFQQDIFCVLLGLKPAHLVDYVPVAQPSKLQLFLQEVRRQQQHSSCSCIGTTLWTSSQFCIFCIGGDVLFVNQTSLNLTRRNNHPVFVNISRSLGKPEIVSTDEARHMATAPFLRCCGLLDKWLNHEGSDFIPIVEYSDHPDSRSGRDSVAECKEGENLCSLFGQLLGYPVVYWFDVEEGYDLDMEELVRYSVLVITPGGGKKKETKGFPHFMFSFTVPSCLLDTGPELTDAAVGSNGSGSDGVKRSIEMWYSSLTSHAAQHHMQLEMRTETVTMPTVAL